MLQIIAIKKYLRPKKYLYDISMYLFSTQLSVSRSCQFPMYIVVPFVYFNLILTGVYVVLYIENFLFNTLRLTLILRNTFCCSFLQECHTLRTIFEIKPHSQYVVILLAAHPLHYNTKKMMYRA